MRHNPPWDDTIFKAFCELAALRLSASRIAHILTERYGVRITRNAVIGKANRARVQIGDPEDRQNTRGRIRAARLRSLVVRPVAEDDVTPAPPVARQIDKHFQAIMDAFCAPAPIRAEAKTMLELKDRGECKWPLPTPDGEPMRFCAQSAPLGEPYCPAHKRQAWRPRQRRRVILPRPMQLKVA